MEELSVNFVDSIEEIGIEEWNALTGIDNPFARYEFLHALESAGCTTDKTGWKPMHVWVTKNGAETESGKIKFFGGRGSYKKLLYALP